MNNKINFTNQNSEYRPCLTCAKRMVHWSEITSRCWECVEDLKIKKFLAPFPPEGQQLDEHLFPVTPKVLTLTL
jgi:hypothetical protein